LRVQLLIMLDRLIELLTSSKIAEALGQIIFTLALSFLPLIFMALIQSNNTQNIGFCQSLIAYFKSGELALYILGICGSIAWLISINPMSKLSRGILIMLGVIIPTLYVSIQLGDNPGFTYNVGDDGLLNLMLLYILVLALWFFTMIIEKPAPAHDDVDKAKKLIKKATGEAQ